MNKIDALESAIEKVKALLAKTVNKELRAELEQRIEDLEAELDKAYDE